MDYAKYYNDSRNSTTARNEATEFTSFDFSALEALSPLENGNLQTVREFEIPMRMVAVDNNGMTRELEASHSMRVRLLSEGRGKGQVVRLELTDEFDIYFMFLHL